MKHHTSLKWHEILTHPIVLVLLFVLGFMAQQLYGNS